MAENPDTNPVITTTKTWNFADESQLADFSLYQSATSAFAVAGGMLKPTGTDGELKAILNQTPADYQSVSVDIIPGASGLINGGLYLGVSNAQNITFYEKQQYICGEICYETEN